MSKYGEDLTPAEQSEFDREMEEVAEDMVENMKQELSSQQSESKK